MSRYVKTFEFIYETKLENKEDWTEQDGFEKKLMAASQKIDNLRPKIAFLLTYINQVIK